MAAASNMCAEVLWTPLFECIQELLDQKALEAEQDCVLLCHVLSTWMLYVAPVLEVFAVAPLA